MFASEKVMLAYLDHLLIEEPETEETPSSTLITAQSSQLTPQTPANNKFSIQKNPKVADNNQATKPEPEIKLKPIASKPIARPILKEPEEAPVSLSTHSVERLLEKVEEVKQQEAVALSTSIAKVEEHKAAVSVEPQAQVVAQETDIPEEPFQALFFEVYGLGLAVPLQELGGIHNLTEVNSLIGKPDWYMGVMMNRDKKLNVVDAARWVMPEKCDKVMEESLNYKYLITLGESNWGLTAEKLVDTQLIHPDAVKWRTHSGKRPWLLGTIKEKMCALLHVGDLIAMLEQGVNARQE